MPVAKRPESVCVTDQDDRQPFDETAVTRGRHRCYFCETEKSDEWKFVARLNAFICRACRERIECIEGEPEDRNNKAG